LFKDIIFLNSGKELPYNESIEGRVITLKILLCCSAGMSSSILSKKLENEINKQGLSDYQLEACGENQLMSKVPQFDLILISPGISNRYEQVKKYCLSHGTGSVHLLSSKDFGRLDARKILNLINKKKLENTIEEEIKMNKFTEILQNKFVPVANKFAKLSFMVILRNSVMIIMPLVIVGAIGTFLANIPFEAAAKFMEPAVPFFNALSVVTTSISGIAISIAVGYNAANHYDLDPISGISVSLASFIAATLTPEFTFNTNTFGSIGIFTAVIVGFISVNIIRLCKKYRFEIHMPKGVPPMVEASFSAITSLAISVVIFLLLNVVVGLDINQLVLDILSPLLTGLNSLPGLLIYVVLCSLLFSMGINSAVIFGAIAPIFTMNSEINVALVATGNAPTQFVTWGMTTFWMAGGCGYAIGLALLLLFSKSKMQKTLGKLAIVPAMFNINEPIIYGLPIMFNPIMIIPFIVIPAVIVSVTWILMSSGIIGVAYIDIPWTTPPILSAYLASGGNIATTLWSVVCVIISVAGYFPFLRIMDKQALANELSEESEAK